jgi:hypothetical protein
VLRLGEDTERQYAPRPAEVRAIIVKRTPKPISVAFTGPRLSMRACEMEAEVRVYARERLVPASAVARELELVLAEKACQGMTVMRDVT